MPQTKKIRVNVCIPVDLELEVTWDGEEATIHDVSLSPYGQMLSPETVYENADGVTFEAIDQATKKAFGIEE